MHKKRNAILAALILAVEAMMPVRVYAVSRKEVDRLVKSLTAAESISEADDQNQDGVVNAIDLTLMKRALLFPPESGAVTEQTVKEIETYTKVIGRTITKDGITWLVHSGSAVECTVTGREASVTIAGDKAVNSGEKSRPRYGVYVDGVLIKDVLMSEKEQTVQLFTGTRQRTATVKVMHLSEANNGAIGVKQFDVKSAAAEPVKPTPKKKLSVEFIGDSITCAYGVEAESQYVGFETGTENFSKSYAYLTAQFLDADYSAVSYSGYGIVSGYTSSGAANTSSLLPPVYENIAHQAIYAVPWDFASHPNDVVVVNLGTNDDSYAKHDLETRGKEYQAGYEAFLKTVRKCNPDAVIICTLGIMGCEELYPYLEAAVKAVGDAKTVCYQSPTQKQSDGYGADWHPSPVTHQINAYILADKICEALGIASSKIGLDMAADGEYGAEIDKEHGANGWPYFSEWDKSMNVTMTAAGDSPEAAIAYVRNLSLPKGSYELSFRATPQKGIPLQYSVRSMTDHSKVYCTGRMNADGTEETVLKAFDMPEADTECEIVFFLGEMSTAVTFHEVTLFKRG
ncbi:MAG: hypothetical protein K6E36_00170 [Oscillospiraceae bacterium]|nr:hypothetical protein [Oscillospiraceae bacterium]